MRIDDFTMLGRTMPNDSKKHGRVVCSAGYSRELRQFLRIYPLRQCDKIPRWSQCQIDLQRNPEDSRIESWRLADTGKYFICGKAIKDKEYDYLESTAALSIEELNEDRRSLGIIKPQAIDGYFSGLKPGEDRQMSLFAQMGAERSDRKVPRVKFVDDYSAHDLQLADWGCAEFLRKTPEDGHYKLFQASGISFNEEHEHLFFVGNHNQHRNAWLIISVITRKLVQQYTFLGAANDKAKAR